MCGLEGPGSMCGVCTVSEMCSRGVACALYIAIAMHWAVIACALCVCVCVCVFLGQWHVLSSMCATHCVCDIHQRCGISPACSTCSMWLCEGQGALGVEHV